MRLMKRRSKLIMTKVRINRLQLLKVVSKIVTKLCRKERKRRSRMSLRLRRNQMTSLKFRPIRWIRLMLSLLKMGALPPKKKLEVKRKRRRVRVRKKKLKRNLKLKKATLSST